MRKSSKLEEMVKKFVDAGKVGAVRAGFITPAMYLSEIMAGMSSSQGRSLRMLGIGVNFFIAYPYEKHIKPALKENTQNIYKRYVHPTLEKYLDIKLHDKLSDKTLNRCAFVEHQFPLYLGMLYAAGAEAQQIMLALPAGLAIGWAIADSFKEVMNNFSQVIHKSYDTLTNITDDLKKFGKSYTKNLIRATTAALAVRMLIGFSINQYNNSWVKNPDKYVQIMDIGTEGFYHIKIEEFNSNKQFLVFAKDTSKVLNAKAAIFN